MLFGSMKRLFGRKEHLRTFFGSHAPPENGQHFPQKLSGEADSDINTLGLCSTYGKANSQATRKVEMKMPSKKCYKAREVRRKVFKSV